MRIAVDVMGGDHGSAVVINGARLALENNARISQLFLVGNEPEIKAVLAQNRFQDSRLAIIHASEVLTMADKPVQGLRRKKDCSILRAVDLVKNNRADALVSAGNTGGLVAASTIRLRPIPGVERPGIATVIPSSRNQFVLLDSGANVESRPMHLAQYAIMGSVYSREVLGYKTPRVGILSNGSEEHKGTELTREAFQLCRRIDIHFVGYVEGHDLFNNRVDVVVCDGFVGNIVLKTIESFAKGMEGWMKVELSKNPKRMLGAMLTRNAMRSIKRRMDPEVAGGALLLGLNGFVMKAHGAASQRAIMSAIRLTSEAVQHHVNRLIREEVARATERLTTPATALPTT